MQLLDGKLVSAAVKKEIAESVEKIIEQGHRPPHLAAILVGTNGASETYVASKVKNCKEVGIESTLIRLKDDAPEKDLLNEIQKLNIDHHIDGILVQLPLPAHIDEQKVINLINPLKDVDGFHPQSVGRLVQGLPGFIPATPYGVMLMLKHYQIPTSGKRAVVIGRSNIVGRPMSILLSQPGEPGNCTVTLCHSKTKDLKAICREADIIVAALGKPEFLKADMVKPGAVVVDVGITRIKDDSRKSGFRIAGDVDFAEVADVCSYISPVPGGVGLMTIAALLQNTLTAYHLNKH